ncbi:MAG: hypothetical protein KDE51_03810 [Anaerolineales bacterium]|nr:hypothetical protein [Anaerolineales bacterium]
MQQRIYFSWQFGLTAVLCMVGGILLGACSPTPPTAVPEGDTEPASIVTAPTAEPTAPSLEPIDLSNVTRTPSQAEGPYYPVEKPSDVNNDLVIVAGATAPAEGPVMHLSGKLYDAQGFPLEGATIEIWQTDNNGIYLHPNDPNIANRDENFQGYGEAVTTADGSYNFITLVPGLYGGRPRHIHVKVKLDGQTLLTTQFYFVGDERLESDGIAAGNSAIAAVTMNLIPAVDENGDEFFRATQDIILGG